MTLTEDSQFVPVASITHLAHPYAASLARLGQRDEAIQLLSSVASGPQPSEAVLDLLARTHAQLGHWAEAESYWKQALVLDPTNEAYEKGIHRIQKMRTRPAWLPSRSAFTLGGLALVFICVISLAASTYLRGPLRLQEKSAHSVALRPAVDLQQPQCRAPSLNLRIPRVSLRTEKQQVVIVFSLGLFAHNARLKPQAEELLTELGSQLSQQITDLDVTVVGHTDDTPIRSSRRYRDNVALGLVRAVTVAEFLRTTAHFPL